MMMNNVVKSSQLAAIFSEFNAIILSDITNRLCRKRTQDFTRNRNMNFYSLIYYFIFRNRTTTNAELSHFYSSIDQFEKRISKQALNKAIRKLNPNVFSYLINRFSAIYYTSSLPKKYRGYFLIAEDGTYMEIHTMSIISMIFILWRINISLTCSMSKKSSPRPEDSMMSLMVCL